MIATIYVLQYIYNSDVRKTEHLFNIFYDFSYTKKLHDDFTSTKHSFKTPVINCVIHDWNNVLNEFMKRNL